MPKLGFATQVTNQWNSCTFSNWVCKTLKSALATVQYHKICDTSVFIKNLLKMWQRPSTSKWIRNDRSRACSQSNTSCLLLNEVGNLIEKHLTDVIAIEEIVRCDPRIFIDVIRQFQWRFVLVNLHVEHKIVILHHKTTCTCSDSKTY